MEEFKKAYKGLNSEQKKAVDHIDGPVLVIAGPGTGKTHLLTTRIANILATTDAQPQNILCLTFTESAAHTMREHLTAILGRAAYDVSISTYHGFGNELIRRYHDYFGETANQHAVEELGIDKIIRDILEKLPYSNPLKGDYYVRDIKSLISDAKRALLTPNDFLDIAASNQKFYKEIEVLIKSTMKDFKRVDKTSGALFQDMASKTASLVSYSDDNRFQPLSYYWQKDIERALGKWEESGKTQPLTAWKNSWLTKDEDGEFIIVGSANNSKIRAFAEIYERYEKSLLAEHGYDYDDMITQAIDGLEKHADLRYTLQETYQYILLDEFQDTNAAQLKLIELLTNNPVNEGRPNVLAVGDDDQAIYAFQGADYSHMLAFTRMYSDVEVITLTKNYRSTSQILQLSSAISSQITERLQSHLPRVDKTLSANISDITPSHVARYEFKSDVAQYAWIAQEIDRLIKSGTAAKEIAVIAPQHRYLEPLVPYLHHGGISVRYEKRENVLDDPLIVKIVVMAKLILSLASQDYDEVDSLWPEVLSDDSWGLATEELWKLSWSAYDDKKHWNNLLIELPQTHDIVLFFTKLSSLVKHETLETMLDYIIGVTPLSLGPGKEKTYRSPLYNYYFGEDAADSEVGDFWQLLSNMTVLRQHLREYSLERTAPLLLGDFTKFVDDHRLANINIINTSPYYESVDAVQLMTAYRAKGQEFTTVFVVGCLDEVWGSGAHRQSSMLALPANLEYIRYAGATADEQLRLFFVALTRAKRNLYLTSYLSTYTNRPLNRLKFLGEVTHENGGVESPLLPAGGTMVHRLDTSAPELVTLTLYWHTRHNEAAGRAELKALLSPRLQHFQLSPTHVNQFVDVLRDGPRYFFMNTLLRFPHARQPSAEYGNAIHESLDWLYSYAKTNSRLPDEKSLLNYFDQQLAQKNLNKEQTKQLKDRGSDTLNAYLKRKRDSINSNVETEFNFRREGVFVDNAHLTGNIDKLIIDKPNKKITVVDYKTGKSHKKWSNDLVLHKYRQQLYSYKILVERSHTFSGYSVDGGLLEFVEPDSNGQINELFIRFDDAEQKKVEDLIQAVWHQIMNLEFPDVSAYSPSLKGIEDFENYLIGKDTSK